MNRKITVIVIICLLFLLSSCDEKQVTVDNENSVSQDLPTLSLVSYQSIPTDFHYDNYAIIDHTVFFHGTDNYGASFFCIDLDTDKKTDIKLPVSGPVMDLSVSNGELCLATVYSSRLDETGTARGYYTLFAISPDAIIRKQVELTGIQNINLLAIGTPVVNGCAILDDNILIIVNNRVILLDDGGELIDYVIMDSGHPRIAGASIKPVCIYDVVDGELTAKLLSVSQGNDISIKPMECSPSCIDIIPTAAKDSVFVVQEKTVYSYNLELQNEQMKPSWTFPYGYSKEKAYYFDGEATLLECYNGRIAVYRIQ